MFLIAGLLAAAAAWMVNMWALRILGSVVIIYLAPLLEESIKTAAAVATGSSVFLTHAVFGSVEAVWDLFTSKSTGLMAGAASCLGHMAFGWIAGRLIIDYGFMAAVAGSTCVHVLWNYFVLKVLVKKNTKL